MARKLRDRNLEDRAARKRLPVRSEPHWRALDQGLHLGYRRRKEGGSWTARRRKSDARYEEAKLGAADDIQDGDGIAVLTYWQALEAARKWFHEAVRRDSGLEPVGTGLYSVQMAVTSYLDWYKRRGGRAHRSAEIAVNAHILPALGETELSRLTTQKIRDWHHGLAEKPPRRRSKRTEGVRYFEAIDDPDALRRRRATANRVLTVLKAALNYAWREGKAAADEPWRRVQPFKHVEAPVERYLTEAECRRLVNACGIKFRPMVRAALLTGCRYGELAMLRSVDFNSDSGTLSVRTSKTGKPRHVVLTNEAKSFFLDATAGKTGADLIFRSEKGTSWGKSHQHRPLIAACKRAKISPSISFHVLRHTHGSLLAMQGVPMPVIARQLGHADTRMTEKHYAHLSPNYVAETIRAHFPKLGIVGKSKISRID